MIATPAAPSRIPLHTSLPNQSQRATPRPGGTIPRLAGLALTFLLPLLLTPLQGAQDTETGEIVITSADCNECHTDTTLTHIVQGKEVPLEAIDQALYDESVHGLLDCTDCHSSITDLPHEDKLPEVSCADCHEDVVNVYNESIHGVSHQMGGAAAATCADCHGTHHIVPVKNADSPVFKLNLPYTCAKCHSNHDLTDEYRIKAPNAAEQYLDSIHGRGLLKMGLIVAPSCNDCHGVHDIVPGNYESSPVHHANISQTCGQCHVKIEEVYNNSVHGQLLIQGHPEGPVCTDCHSAHEIETPDHNGHFKELSDARCGKCHEDSLEHYRETYHGKAMALGRPNVASDVAACFDCHGHHDVLPPSDTKSRLSEQNILATCQSCHPNANAGFVQYQPHANPLDRENYPALNTVFVFMTTLLIGVFSFFGAHTLLWLFRSAWVFLHDSKKFREARVETQADDEWFTRFIPFERFLHFLVVTSFLLLVITGMPLKFYYTEWAMVLFNLMGGPEVARSLHHFGALITFLYFALHLGSLLRHTWRHRGNLRDPESGRVSLKRLIHILFGPDSMIPTLHDWRDFVAHQKWFFGKGKKPQFDRWTYWEKFDYFAVFWGVFAIGLSGLIMWFPEFFTQFLPGWIINIALVVHSDEALLAAGFIFTIHFFNTHFRLEKFPMDTVIFSGRISKAEMLHERRRWYERLVAEGRLEEHRVKDEWERWKTIARSMGYIFFGLGVVLLILIIYAMTTRLTH
ncbi:MAG: cytochrome b/b6 domain-containing protein [Limisphaerales bacterium]